MMHRNRSVDVHQFAMVPRADIPRSSFRRQWAHKTTLDAGILYPILVDEVMPGDSFSLEMTAFCRLATPLFPVMDNMYLDSHFFFVPARLCWDNFKKFMGEQVNPGDSISFNIPQVVSGAGGFVVGSIYDYMGLPTVGQVGGGNTVSVNVLPLRAYNRIYQDWYKPEDLINAPVLNTGDGPDNLADYALRRRAKRHDYFTGCLPSPQKGNTAVSIPLGTTAPVRGLLLPTGTANSVAAAANAFDSGTGATVPSGTFVFPAAQFNIKAKNQGGAAAPSASNYGDVYADLSTATAATINQLRQSFQIQKVLERDARGGTRYVEHLKSHWGVTSPDFRLQRSEYLGGGTTPIVINPVAQTTQTGVTGGATPMGTLAAVGTALARGHGFSQSFTEHGYVIGIVSVRADLTYQQGLRKMWSRSTRYDFYLPAFAMLGEQAVLNKEIYCDGSANDNNVFGYNERWAELRYLPSMITGLFKSTSAGTIDPWHLAQKFTALPTLNQTFIEESPPVSRVVAVGAAANGQQFLFDSFFDCRTARLLPMYSVPGMIDHF